MNSVVETNKNNKKKPLFFHELLQLIIKYLVAILLAFSGYYVKQNYTKIINEISEKGNLSFYIISITLLLFFYVLSGYFINVGFKLLNKVPFVGDTNHEKIRIFLLGLSETVTF
ncbi:MAG: hypothetical protein NTW42_09190 [Deltaproteobacteria bacterium]|nr:hypothetical protein [Deltaproteobacteria bacterium]